jgi:hypothetical protein
MVDVKRSLLFDTYNGYLKTLNKLESIFIAKIDNIGTVMVKAETYHNWHTGDAAKKNIVFMRFTAMPYKERLETHKIVLRDVDLLKILNVEIFQHMGNEKSLIAIFTNLFKHIKLEVTSNFRFLCFPMTILDPKSPYAHLRVGKNVADTEIFEEEDNFISPKVYSRVHICKIVSKIHGQFVVITVMKDLLTKLITLDFYFPQLMRKLNTFLFASNKSNLLKERLAQNVEKLLLKKLDNWHSTFVDISRFQDQNQSMQFQGRSANKKASLKPNEITNYQGYIAKIQALFEDENRGHSFSALNKTEIFNLHNLSLNLDDRSVSMHHQEKNDLTVLSDANSNRFKNQLYWDLITKAISVYARPRNKHILQVGNCRNILKEVIFVKDIIISNQLFRFEVIIEKPKVNHLLKIFKPEMFQNIRGIYYYLKVVNHTSKFERNTKMTFFKALELLDLKFEREYMINIQVVRNIAFLICKKMYFGIKEYYRKREGSDEKLKQGFTRPLTSFIDKTKKIDTTLHTRVCEVVKVKETDVYELLHKTILMIDPMVTLEIHISHEKKEVLFLMYCNQIRNILYVVKKVDIILLAIPFFNQMLALGDKRNLGKRLLLNFKNLLIIKYMEMWKNPSLHDLNINKAMSPANKYSLTNASPTFKFFTNDQTETNEKIVNILEAEPNIPRTRVKQQFRSIRPKVITISHV